MGVGADKILNLACDATATRFAGGRVPERFVRVSS